MKGRLRYIDTMKGILMISVLLHHSPMALSHAGVANPYLSIIWLNAYIIGCFMPAFFFITGFCSNFDAPFFPFLWKNVKTILIPSFCLYYLNHVMESIGILIFDPDCSWVTIGYIFAPGLRTWIFSGGYYWFFTAMFVSRIIYWMICKLHLNNSLKLSISFLLLFVGLFLEKVCSFSNPIFLHHSLVMTFFICVGQLHKQWKDRFWNYFQVFSLLYLVSIPVLLVYGHIPSITRTIDVSLLQIPIFIVLAICGTALLLQVSKKIVSNPLLEYIGRGSMVIYAFNYSTLLFVATAMSKIYIPTNMFESYAYLLLMVLVTLLLLILFNWILNLRYLRVMIGKY